MGAQDIDITPPTPGRRGKKAKSPPPAAVYNIIGAPVISADHWAANNAKRAEWRAANERREWGPARKARLIRKLASRAPDVVATFFGMRKQDAGETLEHLSLTVDGLEMMQRHSRDGGYSAGYSLVHGWLKGYVETTGYIVPTMLDLAARLQRPDLRATAIEQGDWLLTHQSADGGFVDIDRIESYVFDTGQVLIGLVRLFRETGDPRYEIATRRACEWLCAVQAPDGTWTPNGAPGGALITYATRTAAALIEAGLVFNEPRFVEAGERFLTWASMQLMPSGLYGHSKLFHGRTYLLHTTIYVLEGFLHAWKLTGDPRWFEAALAGAEPLKQVALTREAVLRGYYDADLKPIGQQKCLTGLAQWAGVCLEFHAAGRGDDWRDCASNALYYVKSKQLRAANHLRGALPGSVPFWGSYERWAFPSWGLKFFGDALLAFERTGLSVNDQQEIWVRTCHQIYGARVGWADASHSLSAFDVQFMEKIEDIVAGSGIDAPVVVDLGCGEGRCAAWLQARHPDWQMLGVDPLPPTRPSIEVMAGSALGIPLADGSADVIYSAIALQHVHDAPGALAEMRRVLKPGGRAIVFDRDPVSLRGFLKPWHELKGRWIYEWDSPFREAWRGRSAWKAMFRGAGFEQPRASGLMARVGGGLRALLPINRFVLVWGRKGVGS